MRITFEDAIEACESPIEDALLYELAVMNGCLFSLSDAKTIDDLKAESKAENYPLVATQVKVGKYRCDLVVARPFGEFGRVEILGLECDGHAYHRAHAWQIERDRKRDEFLLGEGVDVVRFPGWQLHKDPASVAARVIAMIGLDEHRSATE